MKNTKQMLALALMLLPLTAMAQIGIKNAIVSEVPFDFKVGDKVVPAGKYVVQSASAYSETLLLRNRDAKVNLFSVAYPVETHAIPAGDSLVFHKYGDVYFLSTIRLGGNRTVYKLPETKEEAGLKMQNVRAVEEIRTF